MARTAWANFLPVNLLTNTRLERGVSYFVNAMRIAISGSHATGKSTVLLELKRRLAHVTLVEEPYYQLLAAGHAFSDPPTIEDFETLFEASVATFAASRPGPVAFDRSPADYLAYIAARRPGTALVEEIAATAAAMATLDLVAYVPVERPDRIDVADAPRLRRHVDALLRDMLINQAWGFAVPVVEVRGTPFQRATQLADHIESLMPVSRCSDVGAVLPNERCS